MYRAKRKVGRVWNGRERRERKVKWKGKYISNLNVNDITSINAE